MFAIKINECNEEADLNYMVTFFSLQDWAAFTQWLSNFILWAGDASCKGYCKEKCCVQKCGTFLLLLVVLNSREAVLMI
jgi:hypothetical protein